MPIQSNPVTAPKSTGSNSVADYTQQNTIPSPKHGPGLEVVEEGLLVEVREVAEVLVLPGAHGLLQEGHEEGVHHALVLAFHPAAARHLRVLLPDVEPARGHVHPATARQVLSLTLTDQELSGFGYSQDRLACFLMPAENKYSAH